MGGLYDRNRQESWRNSEIEGCRTSRRAHNSQPVKLAGKCILVAALMISIGAPWALLQSAAWLGMAVTYSVRADSVFVGVSETFDGKHPCPLCVAVSEGREPAKEKNPGSPETNDVKKHLTLCVRSVAVVPPPPVLVSRAAYESRFHAPWCMVPPLPPPRADEFA